MRPIIIATVFMIAISSAAWARWFNQGENSAFADQGTFTVSTINDRGYIFGFRCEQDEVYVVYVTNEIFEVSDVSSLKKQYVTLLTRVDDAPSQSYFGKIDSANRHLRITAATGVAFPKQVSEAKRKITLALRQGDGVVHESSFSAKGSTKALIQFGKSCGLLK